MWFWKFQNVLVTFTWLFTVIAISWYRCANIKIVCFKSTHFNDLHTGIFQNHLFKQKHTLLRERPKLSPSGKRKLNLNGYKQPRNHQGIGLALTKGCWNTVYCLVGSCCLNLKKPGLKSTPLNSTEDYSWSHGQRNTIKHGGGSIVLWAPLLQMELVHCPKWVRKNEKPQNSSA